MNVESLEQLQSVFKDRILPLLQEYFYGDMAKVGMILGNAFVRKKGDGAELAAGEWGPEEFDIPEVYELNDPMELGAEDFQSIYINA